MHIAFVCGGAHGHINPTLPLVEELTRRGHRTSYLTNASFASSIDPTGAALVALPGEMPRLPSEFSPERLARMIQEAIEHATEGFPIALDHLRRNPPDAVCYDAMTFTGAMLAEKLSVPGIVLHPTYAGNEHFSFREELAPSEANTDQGEMVELMRSMHDRTKSFAAAHGVSAPSIGPGSPADMNIVFLPREFQPAGSTFDARFHFVGPSIGNRVSRQDWEPAEGEAPLLFISLGTIFNTQAEFYRTCLDAFGDGPWRVAMATGAVDAASLGPIPNNVETRPTFPQLAVLRHADVFVSHAGMNSTMEAFYFGVPMVAVPQQPEQAHNARQVEALGLGRHLDPAAVSPESLRSAVGEVVADERIRSEVAAMTKVVRNAGGSIAAADAVESYLGV